MKYYFIINPVSGKYQKQETEEHIMRACIKRQIPYQLLYTKHSGDAGRIAAGISDEEECVIFSVGGDGTLNEVLNGMMGAKNKILGNIPMGSGNDFYRTICQLDKGIHTMDAGKINGRYFLNIACIGLDADIANNISVIRKKKWIPVSQRYHASILYSFLKFRYKKLRIQMGESVVDSDCTILAVCNGQYYGGGFRIAPHALTNDGMFDVYVVEKIPKPKILSVFFMLARQKHEKCAQVKRYEDAKVIVDSKEEPYTCNVDGEKITASHFTLEIEKNAVRVFCDVDFTEEITVG